MKLSVILRSKRAAIVAERDALLKDIEAKDFTPEIEARAGEFNTEITELDAKIVEAEAAEAREDAANVAHAAAVAAGAVAPTERAGGAVVGREERTYTADKSARGLASFFSDAYALSENQGSPDAQERLARHAKETVVEGEAEGRAASTSSFAGLIVPQYLVDMAALVLRNGRPLANAVTRMPIPDQGMQFLVPRGTTGAATAIQATENSSVQNTDEVMANVTVPVVTIAGQQDVSRQSLERGTPGIDALIYLDLAGAYAANLDSQIINGSGASGQILGMLNTAGIYAGTAYGAVLTPALFSLKLAGAVAGIAGAGTAIQPRCVVMHPRRWGWLQGQSDSNGRPLALAMPLASFNPQAAVTAPGGYSGQDIGPDAPHYVGILANGLPVITDANIPTNIGTNNEDVVLVLDTQQSILWENGDGSPRQLKFEQTLGNQLTTKLVAYNYAAFTSGRYPGSVGKIGGLDTTATFGQVNPTF